MFDFIDKNMDYLKELSEEYDMPLDVVIMVAEVLGENELYDGVVSALEDGMFF